MRLLSTQARTALIAGLTAAAVLAVVGTAWAHGKLKSSSPSAGAHLTATPRELRLDFTERPELAITTVKLFGPDGKPVPLAALVRASDSPLSVVAAVRGPLTAGTHKVDWVMAGPDGHPMRGSYTFTIVPGAAGLGLPAGTDTPRVAPAVPQPAMPAHHDPVSMPEGPGFNVESPAFVVIRWVQFVGLLIAIGAVVFYRVVLGSLRRKALTSSSLLDDMAGGAARLGHWATWLLAGTLILRLFAQSYALHGPQAAFDLREIATMVARTRWGIGWMVQLAGVIIAGVGFHLARTRKLGWLAASVGVVLLAFTPALSGHASSVPQFTTVAMLADGIHVLGASGWLGSLFIMMAAGIPAAMRLPAEQRAGAVADVVNAFSPTALIFAGMAATTGLFAAWLHLTSVSDLWRTDYGSWLFRKLLILSVVMLTGAYNWLKVRPALGNDAGTGRIRRSATVELSVAVVVLLVTAILVATPPPSDAGAMAAESTTFSRTDP